MKESCYKVFQKVMERKLIIYNELLSCFLEERKSLIDVDLEKLWEISRRKEKLCKKLESLKKKLSKLVNYNGNHKTLTINRLNKYLTAEQRKDIKPVFLRLIRLKQEINSLREENIVVINDSLRFLDDMIAILSSSGRDSDIYDNKCRIRKREQSYMLCRRI